MKILKLTLFALSLCFTAFCQSTKQVPNAPVQVRIPILRASSNIADVRVNGALRKGEWTIDPRIKKDIYYLRRSKKSSSVEMITDIDSISFQLQPGQQFDFIIVLNGKDSCFSSFQFLNSYKKNCTDCVITKDTIPFTLGRDNRIYLEGKINNSETLKILYDNGAEGTGIVKTAVGSKVKIQFDWVGISSGTGGAIETQTSSKNRVEIGGLIWDDEFISTSNKKYGIGADVVVGYSIFSDKAVEIDYEKKIMIIHDSLQSTIGYKKAKAKFIDFFPYLETAFMVNGKSFQEDMFVDIGASGTVFLNANLSEKWQLHNTLTKIDESETSGIGNEKIKNETVLFPLISIGETNFNDIPLYWNSLLAKRAVLSGTS